jgi:hypothetical protein
LRFKIDNDRALNSRDVYLRDETYQVTSQLFTVVVRSTVVFSHGRLHEEVGELRDFPPPPFFAAPRLGEEEATITLLSILESCPESWALANEAT